MCGIAGIVAAKQDLQVGAEEIGRMCQTIVHRGPDDEGIFAKGSVGMGMRRLSIIDLSGGRQPIHNEDRSIWIVFNGEIYNFLELRDEVEKRGHRFYTHSDTEVIVHLYEELGWKCVNKLRGMFAFALYDERRGYLLLARDRLGKKPLHYALRDGRLYFGSEIKCLLAANPQLTDINPQALLQYFYVGYIPDPNTAFAAIAKLPPGHVLEYVDGKAKVHRYWDLPAYGTHDPGSEEECLQELEHKLEEAVRLRLISDVPLGALLSGGVDSSIVVALMARLSGRPIKTFSIGFSHDGFDETEHARAVAERFGTDHHELILRPDATETLESLASIMEEPFGDSSMLPTFYVSRMARRHVKVALSGDGGDELFAGYDRYVVHQGRQKYDRIPSWVGHYFRKYVYPRLSPSLYGRRFAFNILLPARDRYLDSVCHLPVLGRERRLFSNDFVAWAGEETRPLELLQRYFDEAPAPDILSRLLYLDTKSYLTADVLTKVDRMSMVASLEVRCPILDHIFVESAAQLSSRWKLRATTGKYILRKLAERLGVPKKAMERPKQGFAVPVRDWWRKELKKEMLELLLEPRTLQRGYFNPRAVRSLMTEHISGRRDRSYDIWLLLVFELWHRKFLEEKAGYISEGPHSVALRNRHTARPLPEQVRGETVTACQVKP